MEPNVLTYIIGGIALVIGIIAGKLIFAKNTQKKIEDAEQLASRITSEAQSKADTLKKKNYSRPKKTLYTLKLSTTKKYLRKTGSWVKMRTG